MANGFAPYILTQLSEVMKGTIPARKITPVGFLNLLLDNPKPKIIEGVNPEGHTRELRVAYSKRAKAGLSSTTNDCNITAQPGRLEYTVPNLSFRQIALHIPDDTIRKYNMEASKIYKFGPADFQREPGEPGPMMQEMMDMILSYANGLLQDINIDLVTAQASAFGTNAASGAATARTVNFTLATTSNPLGEGMTMVMADAMTNEYDIMNSAIVGGGLINNYMLQQIAKSAAQNGLDTSKLALPKFYFDNATQSLWGGTPTNNFGLFDQDAVALVDVNKYVGDFAGEKGASFFFNAAMPLQDSLGRPLSMNFDFQYKYVDCPTTAYTVGGSSVTVDRGWILIMSKNYALLNTVPATAYASGDPLYGNNGCLLYKATNS